MNNQNKYAWLALAIILGLSAHGYFTGSALKQFKKEDRSISVKGFAEREVKANFAVWTIKSRITTNELAEGSKIIEGNKQKIIDFLLEKGLKSDEIIQKNLYVLDRMARDYNAYEPGTLRYIIEQTIQVRTDQVELVEAASRQTDKLLKAGVVISNMDDFNPSVQYLFTRLNDIKPEMIAEAINNAKQAANEFAKESNTRLGKLKKANQGLFSIVDRDASAIAPAGDAGYYASNLTDVYKKVRVVINAEYNIE